MTLRKFVSRWKQRARLVGEVDAYLHPVGRFQGILECERMRSDRSGTRFALVTFGFPNGEQGKHDCREFVEYLEPRLRATDHAGYLTDRQVGVILWDTDRKGAGVFLETLRAIPLEAEFPPTELFLYPTHAHPPADDDANGRDAWNNVPTANAVEGATEHPLEVLFVKPIPFWKRTLDIIGATVGLIGLAPLMAATALAVKVTSPGPILFKQLRDGLGGKQFTIYKFRTMHVDAEARQAELRKFSEQDGPAFKMPNDPRITPIGRYLRKTCLDELPQLWNVLIGEMSLVGPRPLDSNEMRHCKGWERRRLEVTPGLTCVWQLDGKSQVTFKEWMRMDVRYIKARTMWQDIKLVCRTAVAVLMHRASQ